MNLQPIFQQIQCGFHQNSHSQRGTSINFQSHGGYSEIHSQGGSNINFQSHGGYSQIHSQGGTIFNSHSHTLTSHMANKDLQSHGSNNFRSHEREYSQFHSQGGIIKKFLIKRGQEDYPKSFDSNYFKPKNGILKRVRFVEIFVQDGTDYSSNDSFYFTSLMLQSRKQKRIEEEHVFRDMKHLRFLKKK